MNLSWLRKRHLRDTIDACIEKKKPLELLVEVENDRNDVADFLRKLGVGTVHVYDLIPYISIGCDASLASRIAGFRNRRVDNYYDFFRSIKSVEAGATFSINPRKSSSSCSKLWNLESIGAYEAQQLVKTRGTLAIIDTGTDYGHPELSSNFGSVKGYDFVKDDNDPFDLNGHGTHVAGTAAGLNVGVAPNTRLYSLRVLDADGSGSEQNVMKAIEWAVRSKVDVASLSLGARLASRAFEMLCLQACRQGLVLVAAAGNDGQNVPSFPAAFEGVVAVAAVDEQNQHAYFSNIYRTNDISAPGVGIYSSWPGRQYAFLDGTSMATPHVSAALSLVKAQAKADLEGLMKQTAISLDSDLNYPNQWIFGAGLIRADRLAKKVLYESILHKLLTY